MPRPAGLPGFADGATVRTAYARLAKFYDALFGPALRHARIAAVDLVNKAPGELVLEVGVGTGLALPHYVTEKRITGIDVSPEMLRRARARVGALNLSNVNGLFEMDAQSTTFPDHSFDIAVAMFVASVVPDPQALFYELRRVVRPGGTIMLVNHFARSHGPIGWIESILAPVSARLGWHADFRFEDIFNPEERAAAVVLPLFPLGIFQLVTLENQLPPHKKAILF